MTMDRKENMELLNKSSKLRSSKQIPTCIRTWNLSAIYSRISRSWIILAKSTDLDSAVFNGFGNIFQISQAYKCMQNIEERASHKLSQLSVSKVDAYTKK